MAATLDTERLAEVKRLDVGAHSPGDVMCVMEAVAYVAREPWSDKPECACPVIGTFLRSWNDVLPDDERTALLLPLIGKLVGTRSTKEVEERRSLMAADWLVRVHTPAWLRLAKLDAQADTLERLPEITSMAQVPGIRASIEAVRRDTAAAETAARVAAGDAARVAVRDAVRDAAGDAAGDAARDAAWAAAWAAARAGARVAARAAAGGALADTKKRLQGSAVDLVIRMCEAQA